MDKETIRREMRVRRKALTADERAHAAVSVCGQLWCRCDPASATNGAPPTPPALVAVYLASPDEIDLTPFIARLLAHGVAVVVPRWNGRAYELAHLTTLDPAALDRGPKGILQPAADALAASAAAVTLWVVPGLAFTRAGARLGYGGGWYDRFLAAANPAAPRLGVAYPFQLVDALPTEPHDCALTGLVVAAT